MDNWKRHCETAKWLYFYMRGVTAGEERAITHAIKCILKYG